MAVGDEIFLDTDVVLDHLADRQPFSEYAHRLFSLAEQDEITIYVSALSFSNLYYLLRKLKGGGEALSLLRKLKGLVTITSVGEAEVTNALRENFKDFEDALQCFSARTKSAVKVVVTRNKFDFPPKFNLHQVAGRISCRTQRRFAVIFIRVHPCPSVVKLSL